jgi:hypothetical protein
MSETFGLAFVFSWLLAIPSALAEEVRPDVLLKTMSDEVIAELRKDKSIPTGDAAKIAALV